MQKLKCSDIHIRDPFVLPVPLQQRYYMYGTMGEYTWLDHAVGFDCFVSDDLENWAGPFPVFRPPDDFWSDRSYWAPEVYFYGGRYFMFASFKAEDSCRGTQILTANSPLGPFLPHSKKPVTPDDWECLDGTLHVDAEGKPWMVFCHEWVQVGDGEICAIPLRDDLAEAAGPPIKLFSASQASWTIEINSKGRRGFVTDGPWMHYLPNGELLLLWSSQGPGGYAIGIARSVSGELQGPWQQDEQPVYDRDGGHCMTFRDFNGRQWISFHHPNGYPNERPKFIPLDEQGLMKS